jgi:hypothetical protein
MEEDLQWNSVFAEMVSSVKRCKGQLFGKDKRVKFKDIIYSRDKNWPKN